MEQNKNQQSINEEVIEVTEVIEETKEEHINDDTVTEEKVNEDFNMFEKLLEDATFEEKEKKAKRVITNFIGYIKSTAFMRKLDELANRYNVSKRKIARNFFEKVLAIIGDFGRFLFGTLENMIKNVIDILSTVLKGSVAMISSVASSIVSVLTLNRTNNIVEGVAL